LKYHEQESSELEFKREIPKNEQIIKTIIGFCNQKGGKLILGIDDDGTIVGVDETKVQEIMEYLEKAILDASFPPILTRLYLQHIASKIILFVEVAEGMNKPYYLKKDGKDNGVYIRLGRSTVKANADIIEELKWDCRGLSFDTMPVYQAKENDLDIAKIEKFLATRIQPSPKAMADFGQGPRESRQPGRIDYVILHKAMLAYQIIAQEHDHYYPTTCGILLFGKNPQQFFSEARIMCNNFPGITLEREIIASKECLGTLDEQFQAAYHFVLNQLYVSSKLVGVQRIDKLEIPSVAVREIIMNAVIHRNYHIPGPSKIAIFRNRVEIFSPGSLVGPVLHNLRSGFTYLRNAAICKILREMGLIENFGFGFIDTFASYEKDKLKAPEVIEGENFVKCILPRKTKDNMLVRSRAKELSNEELQIINLFVSATDISVSDVIKILHLTRPTATRKLAQLTQKKLISKIGKGRGTRYAKI